ncbi:hypothetical protein P9112_002361 [Eukaryota sp. TZLM1-RC]
MDDNILLGYETTERVTNMNSSSLSLIDIIRRLRNDAEEELSNGVGDSLSHLLTVPLLRSAVFCVCPVDVGWVAYESIFTIPVNVSTVGI